jgi:hypothetical protein
MAKDTYATNWAKAFLEWNDQGQAEKRSASRIESNSTPEAGQQFVAAYLEWMAAGALAVQAGKSPNAGKPLQHRRKVSPHAIREQTAVLPQAPSPPTSPEIRAP